MRTVACESVVGACSDVQFVGILGWLRSTACDCLVTFGARKETTTNPHGSGAR